MKDGALEVFRALNTPTKLHIMKYIGYSSRTVTEITDNVPVLQPTVSIHLAAMYRAGLVQRSREGREVYYRASNFYDYTAIISIATKIYSERSRTP